MGRFKALTRVGSQVVQSKNPLKTIPQTLIPSITFNDWIYKVLDFPLKDFWVVTMENNDVIDDVLSPNFKGLTSLISTWKLGELGN